MMNSRRHRATVLQRGVMNSPRFNWPNCSDGQIKYTDLMETHLIKINVAHAVPAATRPDKVANPEKKSAVGSRNLTFIETIDRKLRASCHRQAGTRGFLRQDWREQMIEAIRSRSRPHRITTLFVGDGHQTGPAI
jgi:hypothetical protein